MGFKKQHHWLLFIHIHCCPLLSIVVNCCELWSIVVPCCSLLSIVIQCFPLLSVVVQCFPLLSIVIHSCPMLSIAVIHCRYHKLLLDGAVIATFLILLCMFWLNHRCVLRQFFGQINHCWRFSMFSIQVSTVFQYPPKAFLDNKILIVPILNL